MHMGELTVEVPAGRYIVAVSGGVDSMVLLDMLAHVPNLQLIVAHFHHGIRGQDADRDEELVRETAKRYGLMYESDFGQLGKDAGEASAREARYLFLLAMRRKHNADGLVLAHHKDDVVETILINLLRGTAWRGLASLRSHKTIVRPLLGYEKNDLIAYAREHNLVWHEDASNVDQKYLRNYVRWTLIPQMVRSRPSVKDELFVLHESQVRLEEEIRHELGTWTDGHFTDGTLSRYELIMLPPAVGLEVLQEAIRRTCGSRLLGDQAKAALIFAKTARPGTRLEAGGGVMLRAKLRTLVVEVVSKVLH